MEAEERNRLRTLLAYWIDHNGEHAEEFREWMEKARAIGEKEVSDALSAAVEHMNSAGELLETALKKLEG